MKVDVTSELANITIQLFQIALRFFLLLFLYHLFLHLLTENIHVYFQMDAGKALQSLLNDFLWGNSVNSIDLLYKKKKGIEQCWIRCAASLNVLTQQEMKTHLNISMLEHYEIFFCICTTLIFSKLASKVINTSTYNSPQAIRIDFLHVIMSSKYIYLFCALDSCNSTSNAVSPLAISLITDKGKLFGAVNKKILSS